MTEPMNEKPYLVCDYGKSEKGLYAFHVEGFLARDVYYIPENPEKGKKSFARFSLGIGRNSWSLLGEEKNYPESAFLDGVCFGYDADRAKNFKKGQKLVLSGKLQKREFTRKTGEAGYSVEAVCDHVTALCTKSNPGSAMNTSVSHVVRECIKNGEEEKQNLVCLLSGFVASVEPVREVNGNQVLNWQMEIPLEAAKMAAIVKGSYRKEADYGNRKLVRCSVWGKRAEKLSEILDGCELAVTGVPVSRIYQGNEFVDLLVRDLSITRRGKGKEAEESEETSAENHGFPTEAWSGEDTFGDWSELSPEEVPPLPF